MPEKTLDLQESHKPIRRQLGGGGSGPPGHAAIDTPPDISMCGRENAPVTVTLVKLLQQPGPAI
jgi:hypothetical protein